MEFQFEKIQIISFALSLGFLFFVFHLTRKRKIQEAYSILWFVSAIILLILSLWKGALDYFANIFGVYYPPSLLFLGFFFFVLIILIQFSVVITKQNEQIKNISQQLSILEEKTRDDKLKKKQQEKES